MGELDYLINGSMIGKTWVRTNDGGEVGHLYFWLDGRGCWAMGNSGNV